MEITNMRIDTYRIVDELGRIVIPKSIRDELGMKEKDYLKILQIEDNIVLQKTDEHRNENNKNTIRAVDELGRFVLPLELRKKLDIQVGEKLNISINANTIVLEKIN